MAGICGLPVVGTVCSTVGAGVTSAVQQFLDWCTTGLGKIVALMTSGWLKVSTPGVAPLSGSGIQAGSSANGATTTAQWLQDHTLWLSSWLAGVCLVVAGARMAYQMRGLADLRVILEGLIRLVLVNGIVITGTYVVTQIGDSYTNWILQQSLGDNAAQKLGSVTGQVGELTSALGGPVVPLILVGAALVSSLLNLVMGYFRAAILVILAGTIGIPAAAALTDMGRRWLARWLGWLLAFALIKPAAGTVYAAAYKLTGSGDGKDLGSALSGLALLAGAVVVLPALLRLFQPAGMALAGGSGLAGPEHVSGGGGSASGSAAPSGAASSGGQASGSSGSSSPSGAAAGGGSGRAGLTSGQSSGVSSAAGQGARAGGTAAASSGGSSGGKSGGGKGGGGGGASGSGGGGLVAAAAMKAGQHAKQQLVDGLREGAQGLDREMGDGPSGS